MNKHLTCMVNLFISEFSVIYSKGNSGTLVGWLKNQPGYQAFINSLPKKFGRLPGGSGQKFYNLMLGP